ncbi:hypothetical protein Val02_69790 [Virgisporangium aliadipatigenens]|uniref:Uncharacterized protein n=1 Tax=Virgisporangium aliadipatigenens TaxID=741659 RepID=A0A8J3YUR8_9ACTN|nr:hypothetical protein Val02_69790 [Virgisporangium aliadipatigenens]
MLDQARLLVTHQPCEIDPQQSAAPDRNVGADTLADLHGHGQFLFAFSDERVDVGFTRLDLPAGELPATGHFGRIRTFAREHTAIDDDRGSNNQSRHRPFNVHGGQQCQN